jgi:hypothetical protein
MSQTLSISKRELVDELDKIQPVDYLKIFAYLKKMQKPAPKDSYRAMEMLFSLQGCLSDLKVNSVELQKQLGSIWSHKYEID